MRALSLVSLLLACSDPTASAPIDLGPLPIVRGEVPLPEVAASPPEPVRQEQVALRPPRPGRVVVRPAAAPRPTPAPAPSNTHLAILRATVATAITAREPAGVGTSFATSEPHLYFFLELRNDGPPTQLSVVWTAPDGTRGAPVTLPVQTGRRWRTWATTSHAHTEGRWSVIARDAGGHELARREFTLSAAPPTT